MFGITRVVIHSSLHKTGQLVITQTVM
jgi:hypothetical protein